MPDNPTSRHPGRTAAQRRALDAIGCGECSPIMADATRDALLRDGLIVEIAPRRDRGGGITVRIRQYVMPIPVHYAWCKAMEAECEGG